VIATDKFVFIHLHKCGGQFVRDLLLRFVTGAHEIGYHYPRSKLPGTLAHLPVMGFVRNPWDWYVSWYAFNAERRGMNPLFTVLSDNGRLAFKETVDNMLRLSEDRELSAKHREQLKSLFPVSMEGNRASGLTKQCIESMTHPDVGYVTWLYRRMFGVDEQGGTLLLGRVESLRTDLQGFLKQLGVPVSVELQHAIDSGERKNTSNHGPFAEFYDSGLRDLVAQKERTIIGRFDYRFPDQADSARAQVAVSGLTS